MQVKRRLGNLATAVLFLTTCATVALACDDGGYPNKVCVGVSYLFPSTSCMETGCGANTYACCNNAWYAPDCTCVAYGE